MKKHPVLMVSLCVILALGFAGFALAAKKKAVAPEEEVQEPAPEVVPEAAKRYMGQGQAIVERAKSPQDYEEAIGAFEKAASLAPKWPDIYDQLAYAQENAEKYAEAVKSLRKYLTLAPSYVDKKNYEVRIYKLEEKEKYMAGPGVDVKLAQQLVGTWKNAVDSRSSMVIRATGAKVRANLDNITLDNITYATFDAVVEKSRLVGTLTFPGKLVPFNYEINLSPNGRSFKAFIDSLGRESTWVKVE